MVASPEKWNGPWPWVIAALLVASPRLFEQGISLDPALYAVVARNFSENLDWWNLKFSDTLFAQFYEQPFLVFWLQGLLFKVLGVSDHATRVLGLLFGSGTFYFLYRIAQVLSGSRLANAFVLLCLLDLNFVGRFATLYLEVPLTFFAMGSLFFLIRGLQSRSMRSFLVAGIFFGGACLTKGFAALPVLATLVAVGVILSGWRVLLMRGPWCGISVGIGLVGVFCWAQHTFGEYSFFQLYFQNTFLDRTLAVGAGVGPLPFLRKFTAYAALSMVLSVFSVKIIVKEKAYRKVFWVGLVGTIMFVTAGATLGFPYLHYYHGIFPFLYLVASIGVSRLLCRAPGVNWPRLAVLLGVAVHLFWNWAPFPLRRRASEDFYQLRGTIQALAQRTTPLIETVGIGEYDWAYRQFSNWYWGVDSRILKAPDELRSDVVVAVKDPGALPSGYQYCIGSKRYDVWVRDGRLLSVCRDNPQGKSWIK